MPDKMLDNEEVRSVSECVVCLLIIKGFSRLNFADKLELITKGWVEQPINNQKRKWQIV